jgi:hypothetical protein
MLIDFAGSLRADFLHIAHDSIIIIHSVTISQRYYVWMALFVTYLLVLDIL